MGTRIEGEEIPDAPRDESSLKSEELSSEDVIELVGDLLPKAKKGITESEGFRTSWGEIYREIVDGKRYSFKGDEPIFFEEGGEKYSFYVIRGEHLPKRPDDDLMSDQQIEILELKKWNDEGQLSLKAFFNFESTRLRLISDVATGRKLDADVEYGETLESGLRVVKNNIEAKDKANRMLQPFLGE